MRSFLKVVSLSISVFLISFSARAGILLEPILKYESNTVTSNGTTTTASGGGFGARVGYEALLLWVALDYSSMSGTVKTPSASDNGTETQAFVDLGVRVPLLRAWVGYGLSNKLTDSTTSTSESGDAIKLGVGYTGLPFLAINFEYVTSTYKKISYGGTESDLSGTTGASYSISVSAPFDF